MLNLTVFNQIEIPYNTTQFKLINNDRQIQMIFHNSHTYSAEKIVICDSDNLQKKEYLDISQLVDKLILSKMIFDINNQYIFIEQSYGALHCFKKTSNSLKFISEFTHPKIESISYLITNRTQNILIISNYTKEIVFFNLDDVNITYIKHYNLQMMSNVYDLVLSPDESKLLVYGIKTYFNDDDFESNVIEIFDIYTNTLIFLINGIDYTHTTINYNNNPHSYAFLNNDTLIVSCESNYIQIWNINQSEIEDTLYSSYKICCIKTMNHTPNIFIAGTTDGNILIFDLNKSQYINESYNNLIQYIPFPNPDILQSRYIRHILIDQNDELIYVNFPGNTYIDSHTLKILSTHKYKYKQLTTLFLILYRLSDNIMPNELCDFILQYF